MNQKKIILIIGIVVLVLVVVVAGIYSSKSKPKNAPNQQANNTNTPLDNKIKLPTLKEIEAQNKTNFPDTITGTINFLDKGSVLKTTVKTADNITYILSPNQPKAVYGSFGVKNGGKVQIQGKAVDNELRWITMKPI